ncbi:MAG TPA: nitrate/nitrite transporter NrtS [Chloroflexota bacterium]|nr:nitrate/nitrite transporter NrtS [Chloroflexota bacterium]
MYAQTTAADASAATTPARPPCASCQAEASRRCYRFDTPTGPIVKCGLCALRHRPLVLNALKTAALVGTALTAINQGDVLLHGAIAGAVLAKMGLTYLVPYLVSTSGALAATRVRPRLDRAVGQ